MLPRLPESLSDVELQLVDRRAWLVVNARVDRSDPAAILGFVQETDGGFEVTMLGNQARFLLTESLADARRLFAPSRPVAVLDSHRALAHEVA